MPPAKRTRRRPILLAALCVVLGLTTSVGVAWGIAWDRNLSGWSSRQDTAIFLPDEEPGRSMPYTWLARRFASDPLVITWFAALPRKMAEGLAQYNAKGFDEDLAEFSVLADDAASRRALARHLPLIQSNEDGNHVTFTVDRAGWPFLALAVERACTLDKAIARKQSILSQNPTNSQAQTPDPNITITNPAFNLLPHYNAIEIGNALLPTFPLWPGLLANTAIYGSAWALLIGGPILLRRWLRARKGGCGQCGYSREGLKMDAPCPECGRVPALAPS